jgi:hypothetical protein
LHPYHKQINFHIIKCIGSDIHESYEYNISEEEWWVKIDVERKRLTYIQKDYFEKSQDYRSTGESRPPFPQKTVLYKLTNLT